MQQPAELEQQVIKTAALMEQFQRSCEGIDQRLLSLGDQVQDAAQQLPLAAQQAAASALKTLPDQVMRSMHDKLQQPVQNYQQALDQAGGEIRESTHALAQQIERMEHLHRMLIWKTLGAAVISLLLLLAGGVWLAMHYASVIRENQISADLLKAYNSADVVPCGNRLCASVDLKGQRYGNNGEYLPIRSR